MSKKSSYSHGSSYYRGSRSTTPQSSASPRSHGSSYYRLSRDTTPESFRCRSKSPDPRAFAFEGLDIVYLAPSSDFRSPNSSYSLSRSRSRSRSPSKSSVNSLLRSTPFTDYERVCSDSPALNATPKKRASPRNICPHDVMKGLANFIPSTSSDEVFLKTGKKKIYREPIDYKDFTVTVHEIVCGTCSDDVPFPKINDNFFLYSGAEYAIKIQNNRDINLYIYAVMYDKHNKSIQIIDRHILIKPMSSVYIEGPKFTNKNTPFRLYIRATKNAKDVKDKRKDKPYEKYYCLVSQKLLDLRS